MVSLRIQLLGDFRIEYRGDLIRAVDRARLQLLLAYLLLHRHAPQLRQRIAFQFWPDSSEHQARNNLRKALHELRQVWPDVDSFLYMDAQTMQWRPDASYSLDVTEFEELIAQANARADHPTAQRVALEAAVALYHGDLLPSSYDDWLIPERERLRQAFTEALESLVCLTEEQRDYTAAIHHANHLLRYDPLHEVTYRRLMRLHAVNGDRAAALQVYHTCVIVLERELGGARGSGHVALSTGHTSVVTIASGGTPTRMAHTTRRVGKCHARSRPLLSDQRRGRHRQNTPGRGVAGLDRTARYRHSSDTFLRRHRRPGLHSGNRMVAQ